MDSQTSLKFGVEVKLKDFKSFICMSLYYKGTLFTQSPYSLLFRQQTFSLDIIRHYSNYIVAQAIYQISFPSSVKTIVLKWAKKLQLPPTHNLMFCQITNKTQYGNFIQQQFDELLLNHNLMFCQDVQVCRKKKQKNCSTNRYHFILPSHFILSKYFR